MGKGWAVVTLFGGLSYVVELTREFREIESRSFSIYYDVETGAFQPVVLASEYHLVGRVLSVGSVFEDLVATAEYWRTLIEPVCAARGDQMSTLTDLPLH